MVERYCFFWSPDVRFWPEREYICKSFEQAKKMAGEKIRQGSFGDQTRRVYIYRETLFDSQEEAENHGCFNDNWQECRDLLRLGYMHETGNVCCKGSPLYAAWKDELYNDFSWC